MRMCSPRLGAEAEVKRVVLVPLSDRMWMPPDQAFKISVLGRSGTKPPHFIHLHIAEYTMMAILAFQRSEQAEEKEYVADTDTIPLQMRLRCTSLPEGPTPITEHRVFVAEIGSGNAPFSHLLDDLSKP